MSAELDEAIEKITRSGKFTCVEIDKQLRFRFSIAVCSATIASALLRLTRKGSVRVIGYRNGYDLYTTPRRAPSDRDLLVMFICQWRDPDGSSAIDWTWARTATDREIIDRFRSLYQIDHDPFPRHLGGPDRGWNYQPLRKQVHQKKTSKRDIPQAAKSRRIAKKRGEHEESRRLALAISSDMDQIMADSSSRAKLGGRKLPSRKMGYRRFDGTPVRPGRKED